MLNNEDLPNPGRGPEIFKKATVWYFTNGSRQLTKLNYVGFHCAQIG